MGTSAYALMCVCLIHFDVLLLLMGILTCVSPPRRAGLERALGDAVPCELPASVQRVGVGHQERQPTPAGWWSCDNAGPAREGTPIPSGQRQPL